MPAILSRAPAILPGVPMILAVPAEQICIARLQSRARPAPCMLAINDYSVS